MTKKQNTLPNLEESLTEVSGLIDKMEHGELTLEQSLHHFERGVLLIKHCHRILEDAEQKVQILMQNQQQENLIPYSENNKEEGPSANEDDK